MSLEYEPASEALHLTRTNHGRLDHPVFVSGRSIIRGSVPGNSRFVEKWQVVSGGILMSGVPLQSYNQLAKDLVVGNDSSKCSLCATFGFHMRNGRVGVAILA